MATIFLSSLAFIIVFVIVLITLLLFCLHTYIIDKKRERALNYVLQKTSRYYFWGYPLSACLKADAAWQLSERNVGIFTEQIGLLVLCALNDSDNDSIMFSHQLEKSDSFDYDEAVIRFNYEKKRWQFDLLDILDEDNMELIGRNGKGNFPVLSQCRCTTFWSLDRGTRRKIEKCIDPNESALKPEILFEKTEPDFDYFSYIKKEIGRIVNHQC